MCSVGQLFFTTLSTLKFFTINNTFSISVFKSFIFKFVIYSVIVQYAKKNLEKKSFKVNTTFAVYIYM